MKKISTTYGTLSVSQVPAEEDLIGYHFDIIWNLAAELKKHSDWQKEFANLVLLGNIDDYDIPNDVFAFKYQLEQVVNCLKNGGSVLVHCLGGHGRTGMAVACILNRLEGISANESLKVARRTCFGPEVEEQIEFVKSICKETK